MRAVKQYGFSDRQIARCLGNGVKELEVCDFLSLSLSLFCFFFFDER
jgi:hypothetical protein